MVRRVSSISLGVALSFVLATASALAHSRPPQSTDPSADSPAGVIYAIPLDTARQDAAPHTIVGTGGHNGPRSGGPSSGATGGSANSGSGTVGGSASGGSSNSSGSANGTSGGGPSANAPTQSSAAATHPGSSAHGGGRTSSGSTRSASDLLVPGGQPGSLIHSDDGFGSSPLVPGFDSPPAPGLRTVNGSASSAPLLALLLAIVVVALGGYAGARAWQNANRRSGKARPPLAE